MESEQLPDIGSALTRLERQLSIGTFVRRFPDVQLAAERPDCDTSFRFRELRSLSVRL